MAAPSTSQQDPSQTMEVDPQERLAERNIEIEKLMSIIEIIITLSGNANKDRIQAEMNAGIIDIDFSDELSGILMTVFTCLRKEIADPTGSAKYKSYSATINNVEITIASIVDEVKKRKIEINFMISTPIVELMTLFKASFDEVRTGVTRFRVRESVAKRAIKRDASGRPVGRIDKSRELSQNITQYGLNNHHVPLLQGITFAPERRTGIIRSLGPMSQAIMMVMEDRYHNKLASALMTSLQMLPMASEITACLREARSPGSVAGILKELGDILIMTTARSTQKFYFPLLLYALLWRKQKIDNFSWSSSGSDMLKAYSMLIYNGSLKFKIRSGSDKVKTSQVVFHAMFGTYLDDLDICEQISTHNGRWFQRKDVNSVFLKRSAAQQLEFVPIGFKYVSKMAQALLTKSLGNVDPVDTCRPSFSGIRKRGFTQDFLNYLRTGKAAHSFSNDPIQLQYALKKTKDQVMEDVDSIKILKAGTTQWETFENGAWTLTNFEAVEGNRKFFGI